MTHRCRAPGCDKRITSGLLLCKPHWWKVPPNVRAEVSETWRRVTKAGDGNWLRAPAELREAWKAAAARALAAVGADGQV
jgi:hypothetical protein